MYPLWVFPPPPPPPRLQYMVSVTEMLYPRSHCGSPYYNNYLKLEGEFKCSWQGGIISADESQSQYRQVLSEHSLQISIHATHSWTAAGTALLALPTPYRSAAGEDPSHFQPSNNSRSEITNLAKLCNGLEHFTEECVHCTLQSVLSHEGYDELVAVRARDAGQGLATAAAKEFGSKRYPVRFNSWARQLSGLQCSKIYIYIYPTGWCLRPTNSSQLWSSADWHWSSAWLLIFSVCNHCWEVNRLCSSTHLLAPDLNVSWQTRHAHILRAWVQGWLAGCCCLSLKKKKRPWKHLGFICIM